MPLRAHPLSLVRFRGLRWGRHAGHDNAVSPNSSSPRCNISLEQLVPLGPLGTLDSGFADHSLRLYHPDALSVFCANRGPSSSHTTSTSLSVPMSMLLMPSHLLLFLRFKRLLFPSPSRRFTSLPTVLASIASTIHGDMLPPPLNNSSPFGPSWSWPRTSRASFIFLGKPRDLSLPTRLALLGLARKLATRWPPR